MISRNFNTHTGANTEATNGQKHTFEKHVEKPTTTDS